MQSRARRDATHARNTLELRARARGSTKHYFLGKAHIRFAPVSKVILSSPVFPAFFLTFFSTASKELQYDTRARERERESRLCDIKTHTNESPLTRATDERMGTRGERGKKRTINVFAWPPQRERGSAFLRYPPLSFPLPPPLISSPPRCFCIVRIIRFASISS